MALLPSHPPLSSIRFPRITPFSQCKTHVYMCMCMCAFFLFKKMSRQACGPISSFKRLITPANKPQGFGFAEFQDPDGALRAMALLNNVELPALEDGCVNKKLLVSPFICISCFMRGLRLGVVVFFARGVERSRRMRRPRCFWMHTKHRRCQPVYVEILFY